MIQVTVYTIGPDAYQTWAGSADMHVVPRIGEYVIFTRNVLGNLNVSGKVEGVTYEVRPDFQKACLFVRLGREPQL